MVRKQSLLVCMCVLYIYISYVPGLECPRRTEVKDPADFSHEDMFVHVTTEQFEQLTRRTPFHVYHLIHLSLTSPNTPTYTHTHISLLFSCLGQYGGYEYI